MAASKTKRPTAPLNLPTMQTAAWAMSHFRDSSTKLLKSDRNSSELRLYFYAATMSGWTLLASSVDRWMRRRPKRPVCAYLGTDHALTDPDAIDAMHAAGVQVYLLRHYRGVFHPKVVWFVQQSGGILLAGSNNLTEDGLSNNIEFATLTTLSAADATLKKWHEEVHAASDPYSKTLVDSYRREKEHFGKERAKSGTARTFTWSGRTSGKTRSKGTASAIPIVKGDLVLEVMPRETSAEGRQVQIPMSVATSFFGLGVGTGSSKQLSLTNEWTKETRTLTMTRNSNSTTRLSIRELEYRSRPCVLRIRKHTSKQFSMIIVRQSIDPAAYKSLLALCPQSSPKRRWKIVKKGRSVR